MLEKNIPYKDGTINISYDESSSSLKEFAERLGSHDMKEEVIGYYKETKASPDRKIHLEDKYGNKFTLVCDSSRNCTLRKRGV